MAPNEIATGRESLSLVIMKDVIPKSPRFYQRAEGSPVAQRRSGDRSLRLKNGYAREPALSEVEGNLLFPSQPELTRACKRAQERGAHGS